MAATGAMAVGVIGIAKAFTFLTDTIADVKKNLSEFGWQDKGFFGTLGWTWGVGGLQKDKDKQQDLLERNRSDAISRASKAIKGPDAEERVLRWMRANKVGENEDVRIAERLRMEQAQDAIKHRPTGVDSLTQIGLNTAYSGGVEYAQRTANSTEQIFQLLRDFVGGRLGVVNNVAVAQ
jgi:hypothetical protein